MMINNTALRELLRTTDVTLPLSRHAARRYLSYLFYTREAKNACRQRTRDRLSKHAHAQMRSLLYHLTRSFGAGVVNSLDWHVSWRGRTIHAREMRYFVVYGEGNLLDRVTVQITFEKS